MKRLALAVVAATIGFACPALAEQALFKGEGVYYFELAAGGVDGVLLLGTTGEGVSFSLSERKRLLSNTASSSPRFTRCNTVCRETRSFSVVSSIGRYSGGASPTMRARNCPASTTLWG